VLLCSSCKKTNILDTQLQQTSISVQHPRRLDAMQDTYMRHGGGESSRRLQLSIGEANWKTVAPSHYMPECSIEPSIGQFTPDDP
jgi:hypothetical protein